MSDKKKADDKKKAAPKWATFFCAFYTPRVLYAPRALTRLLFQDFVEVFIEFFALSYYDFVEVALWVYDYFGWVAGYGV